MLTVLRTCRDLGHFPLKWAEFLEPSQPYFKLLESKRCKLNQKVKQTRAKKEMATIAMKGPKKGRDQVNFGRTFLTVDQKKEAILPLPKLGNHLAWVYISLIITYLSCYIDPSAAGNISYCTNSALFCQKAARGHTVVKNHLSQGNKTGPKTH